jgi:hypothetical protein
LILIGIDHVWPLSVDIEKAISSTPLKLASCQTT